jgi:CW-type Zinc Finger
MPPKVARRKKQSKEQLLHSEIAVSRKADAGDEDDYDEDEENAQESEKPVTSTSRVSKSSAAGSAATNSNCDKASSSLPPEDDRVWVQCNTCDKWRALPSTVDPALLPDIWFCELNIYDLARNCCEVSCR